MKKKLLLKELTIIIPFYNEAKRCKSTFRILEKFIKQNKIKLEIIFVNDGSKDQSYQKIKNFILATKRKNVDFEIINYKKNMGKGYALKQGIKKSSNQWILTCDFDMSVNPTTLLTWFKKNYIDKIKAGYIGSRNLLDSNVDTIWIRKLYGLFFTLIINILFKIKLKDTQCGFKLYHSSYIKKTINTLKSYRFVHDVEIIVKLTEKNIKIKELPLKWSHKKGSKINLFKDPIIMILDLILIKLKK